ncbi:MAG: cation diffusion facilitator family transporter [Saprospiraceae bacterium]
MEITNEKAAIKAAWFSIIGNILLASIKLLAGLVGNAYALIADGIESTTDVFSSIIVLLGFKYAQKPPDKNHPYGHTRVEPLITFLVVAFLVSSAVVIAYESIINIKSPQKIPEAWTLIVLGVIIIWKELSYRYVMSKSKKTNSSSLKADAWHHRSDAITSITAFIGISIAIIFGKGFETADDWAALFASAFILYNAYNIFRPALGEIMDEHVYDDMVQHIRDIAMEVDGISGTEKCFVRKAGMKYLIELHALVDGNISVNEGHYLSHKLQDKLQEKIPEISHITIHIEPEVLTYEPKY